jgi:hypothetical protein
LVYMCLSFMESTSLLGMVLEISSQFHK